MPWPAVDASLPAKAAEEEGVEPARWHPWWTKGRSAKSPETLEERIARALLSQGLVREMETTLDVASI